MYCYVEFGWVIGVGGVGVMEGFLELGGGEGSIGQVWVFGILFQVYFLNLYYLVWWLYCFCYCLGLIFWLVVVLLDNCVIYGVGLIVWDVR